MQTYGKENISTPSSSDRNEPLATSPAPNKTVPVRPLTAAYQAARSDHQVKKQLHNKKQMGHALRVDLAPQA